MPRPPHSSIPLSHTRGRFRPDFGGFPSGLELGRSLVSERTTREFARFVCVLQRACVAGGLASSLTSGTDSTKAVDWIGQISSRGPLVPVSVSGWTEWSLGSRRPVLPGCRSGRTVLAGAGLVGREFCSGLTCVLGAPAAVQGSGTVRAFTGVQDSSVRPVQCFQESDDPVQFVEHRPRWTHIGGHPQRSHSVKESGTA